MLGLFAGTLLVGVGGAVPAESAVSDEETLRKQALSLNDVTGTEPMSHKLQQLAKEPASAKKLLLVARKMTKKDPQPFNRNATFLFARLAENLKDVDTSATFYRLNAKQALSLASERGLTEAYVGLIRMYTLNKRFAETEKVCKEFLAIQGEEDDAIERFKPMVLENMILAVARQGATDRAHKLIDDQLKANPRNWLFRALKGRVYREAEKYDEAAKVYLDVIDRVKRDGRLEKEDQNDYIDTYRYMLSGIYVDLGNVEKAAEQLKLLLEREPNNPTYNNDLGFIWADRGLNLPEAEKLIRKAIDEDRKLRRNLADEDRKEGRKPRVDVDKDNGAYLDSLGWVLFKQGKAKEAKPHLLEAVKQREEQSIEIYDHLGDVLLALDEKTEAIAAWKKGLEVVTDSKRDQKRKVEVEKKIKMAEGK
jgi:tetratricopeptide (TPR) repeat protein